MGYTYSDFCKNHQLTNKLWNVEKNENIPTKSEKNRTKLGNPYYLVLLENRTKPGTVLNKTLLSWDSLYKLLMTVFWPHLGWKRTLTSSHGLMATWGCQSFHFLPLWHWKITTRTKNCFCHWENDKCKGVKYSCIKNCFSYWEYEKLMK